MAIQALTSLTLEDGPAIITWKKFYSLRQVVLRQAPEHGMRFQDKDLLLSLLSLLPSDKFSGLRGAVLAQASPDVETILNAICRVELETASSVTSAASTAPIIKADDSRHSLSTNRISRGSRNYHNTSRRQKGDKCDWCGKDGHQKRFCYRYKADRSAARTGTTNKTVTTDTLERVASTSTPSPLSWLLDSGASRHMTDDPRDLISSRLISPVRVEAAGKTLWARRVGSGLVSDGKGGVIRVNNILLVDGLRMKLLSVSALCSRGGIMMTDSNTMTLYERSSPVLSGSAQGGVYIFDRVYDSITAAPVVIAEADVTPRDTSLYHNRFSYLDPRGLRGISACIDSKIPQTISNSSCDICVLTKLTNRHQKSEARATAPLERVSADFVGPFHASLEGNTILLTITDSYSRKIWVYGASRRSDAGLLLRQWRPAAELSSGCRLKAIRTDNAPELTKVTRAWRMDIGISDQSTVPFNSSQNGLDERTNRTIQDQTRALLKQAKLPNSFWLLAAQAAAYITNLLPSQADGTMSREEAFSGVRPSANHIKVWGCRALIYMAPESLPSHVRNNKLMDRAKECIFVRYVEGSTS